jgi:GAF domain-containing protein
LVVWVSDRAGAELRPVLSYGYPEKIVAQMRSIPRDAQNAAALAFRSGQARVVAGTDMANGAVVVPLITPAGCVGVLAAELRHGSEQRESTRALATILAAQLATLVGTAPSTGAAQAQA